MEGGKGMKGYDLPKMKLNPVVEEFVNRIPDKEARLILSKMVEMYIQGRMEHAFRGGWCSRSKSSHHPAPLARVVFNVLQY